jgi:putative oxidoreductase
MTVTHALARPMLAGMFVYGGFDALRNPEGKAPKAEAIAPAIAEPLGLPADTVTLVRLNGAIQVAGGTLLALGKMPRLAATALAASLVPTTYAGHRFWEETDERQRAQQRVHFLKNVAMLGGLILAATDTAGRPSLTCRARRAVRRATTASHPVTERAAGLARDRAEDAMDAFATMSSGAADARQRASKATRRAAKRAATGAAHASAAASAAMAGAKAAERARALGTKAGEVAIQRTRDVVDHARDGGFERAKDAALELARETVDRAREVLPVAI